MKNIIWIFLVSFSTASFATTNINTMSYMKSCSYSFGSWNDSTYTVSGSVAYVVVPESKAFFFPFENITLQYDGEQAQALYRDQNYSLIATIAHMQLNYFVFKNDESKPIGLGAMSIDSCIQNH